MKIVVLLMATIFAMLGLPASAVYAADGAYPSYVPLNTWWVILIIVLACIGTIALTVYLIVAHHKRQNIEIKKTPKE